MTTKTPETPHFWEIYNNILVHYNAKFMKKYIGCLRKDDDKKEKDDYSSYDETTTEDYDTDLSDEMLEFEEVNMPPITEIFDLEGTLIITRNDEWDYAEGVLDKFCSLAKDNYFLCVITNVNGMKNDLVGSDKLYTYQKKIENMINKLTHIFTQRNTILYAFSIFVMDSHDVFYRKPYPGCWNIIQGFIPLKEVYKPIKYIGDEGGRDGDASSIDRKFAINSGLTYTMPEEFFLDNYTPVPYIMGFDPRMYITTPSHIPNSQEQVPAFDQVFTDEADTQYLIIIVGYPGSGKTTFVRNLLLETDEYIKFDVISYDEYPKVEKAQKQLKNVLESGGNAIMDYNNASKYDRSGWICFAKDIIPNIVVCVFEMTTPRDLSMHLNIIRARKKKNTKKLVPERNYSKYDKNYEKISRNGELIDRHYKIPFIPMFNDVDKLVNFLLYT